MTTTTLEIVNDNGNMWGCTLMYDNIDYAHFKIGDGWKRMVVARNLRQRSAYCLVHLGLERTRLFTFMSFANRNLNAC